MAVGVLTIALASAVVLIDDDLVRWLGYGIIADGGFVLLALAGDSIGAIASGLAWLVCFAPGADDRRLRHPRPAGRIRRAAHARARGLAASDAADRRRPGRGADHRLRGPGHAQLAGAAGPGPGCARRAAGHGPRADRPAAAAADGEIGLGRGAAPGDVVAAGKSERFLLPAPQERRAVELVDGGGRTAATVAARARPSSRRPTLDHAPTEPLPEAESRAGPPSAVRRRAGHGRSRRWMPSPRSRRQALSPRSSRRGCRHAVGRRGCVRRRGCRRPGTSRRPAARSPTQTSARRRRHRGRALTPRRRRPAAGRARVRGRPSRSRRPSMPAGATAGSAATGADDRCLVGRASKRRARP